TVDSSFPNIDGGYFPHYDGGVLFESGSPPPPPPDTGPPPPPVDAAVPTEAGCAVPGNCILTAEACTSACSNTCHGTPSCNACKQNCASACDTCAQNASCPAISECATASGL